VEQPDTTVQDLSGDIVESGDEYMSCAVLDQFFTRILMLNAISIGIAPQTAIMGIEPLNT